MSTHDFPTPLDHAVAADLRAHWDEMEFDSHELAASLAETLTSDRHIDYDADADASECPDLFELATGMPYAQLCDPCEFGDPEAFEAKCDAAMARWVRVVRLAARTWLTAHPETLLELAPYYGLIHGVGYPADLALLCVDAYQQAL